MLNSPKIFFYVLSTPLELLIFLFPHPPLSPPHLPSTFHSSMPIYLIFIFPPLPPPFALLPYIYIPPPPHPPPEGGGVGGGKDIYKYKQGYHLVLGSGFSASH